METKTRTFTIEPRDFRGRKTESIHIREKLVEKSTLIAWREPTIVSIPEIKIKKYIPPLIITQQEITQLSKEDLYKLRVKEAVKALKRL